MRNSLQHPNEKSKNSFCVATVNQNYTLSNSRSELKKDYRCKRAIASRITASNKNSYLNIIGDDYYWHWHHFLVFGSERPVVGHEFHLLNYQCKHRQPQWCHHNYWVEPQQPRTHHTLPTLTSPLTVTKSPSLMMCFVENGMANKEDFGNVGPNTSGILQQNCCPFANTTKPALSKRHKENDRQHCNSNFASKNGSFQCELLPVTNPKNNDGLSRFSSHACPIV